jgi:hypothetical protein
MTASWDFDEEESYNDFGVYWTENNIARQVMYIVD